MHNARDLRYFPISLFSATMGWSGLALAFYSAYDLLSLPASVYQSLFAITLVFFGLLTLGYLAKTIKHPQAVKAEFNHPIAVHFFPTVSISLLLISLLLKDIQPQSGEIIWFIGAALQLVLTIIIINRWIYQPNWEPSQANPTWFLPVVGNVVAPLGAMLYGYHELGWFFFSIGVSFWLVIKAILVYRLIFQPFLQPPLIPTLFIFIAPPAMAFLAYVSLNDHKLDAFAHILYYAALFITLWLFSQGKRFISLPFMVSWWAYTFPLAAMTNASFVMYELTMNKAFGYLASVFIALLAALIVHLTLRTLLAIKNREICLPPPAQTAANDKA
jgi:tellurite resistance protein